jgi:hypothetical protein
LTATDTGGSGVASTHYTTDGTDPTLASPTYSAPFAVPTTSTVRYRSWDNAGNVEATHAQTIHIDTTAPVSAITCNGVTCSDGAYAGTVTVALTATDTGGSGVASTHYTTDGTDPTLASPTYSVPFAVASTTTVKYRSWDNAGNMEATRSQTIQVDASSSLTISLSNPTDGASFSWKSRILLEASVTDNVTITRVVFSVDGAAVATDTAYPYAATWRPGRQFGSHVVTATAYDVTGNSRGSTPVRISIV